MHPAELPVPPERPTFLYRLQVTRAAMVTEGPTPAEQQVLGEHFAYLRDLARAGVVLLAGRTLTTDPLPFGLVIFFAVSESAARQVMDGDPAVKGGVMRAELFPYRIALLGQSEPTRAL
jgi:uncharacterized protein YciI